MSIYSSHYEPHKHRLPPSGRAWLGLALYIAAAAAHSAPIEPPGRIFSDSFEPNPVFLSAGAFTSCALMSDTSLRCWGDNLGGQAGNPSAGITATHAVPVLNADGTEFLGATAVTVGNWHVCALTETGEAYCWGVNSGGELGLGMEDAETHAPTLVPNLAGSQEHVVQIAAGRNHTCALISSGNVKCWGANQHEESGQDNPNAPFGNNVDTPTLVDLGGASATQVIAGAYFSCALTTNGLMCWGLNVYGELGRSTGTALWDMPALSALELGQIRGVVTGAIAEHVCARTDAPPHHCWGRYNDGQQGDGTFTSPFDIVGRPTPSDMLADPGFWGSGENVGVGALNTCEVYDGALSCTGDNSYYQLGQLDPPMSPVLIATPVSQGASQVVVGAGFVCALVFEHVKCWGVNDSAALGRDALCDGSPEEVCTSPAPTDVRGLP